MEKEIIEKYVEQYVRDCQLKRLSDKTIKAYRIDLKQFVCDLKEETDTHKQIIDYLYKLNQKYEKPKTIKRKIACIKAFYAYLEYQEIIAVSPFRKIKIQMKEPKLLPKVITRKDMEKILNDLYECINQAKTNYEKEYAIRNTAIIELLFSTGIRISELCHIKNDDIHLQERTLKILGKGSKERILYIGNDAVINILKEYINVSENNRKQEYFFTNRFHQQLSEQSVRIMINKLEKKLALPYHITPHMFRHTFATQLLEKDVDIRYIQKILGHSSISITQIYTHVSYPKQKEIMTIKNPRNDFSVNIR